VREGRERVRREEKKGEEGEEGERREERKFCFCSKNLNEFKSFRVNK
jgi:hypothetical protein